jgi:hypothetical protein
MAKRWWAVLALGLVPTLGLAACGGRGGGDGVATLGGEAAGGDRDEDGSGDAPSPEDAQDAFRDFARCMREHGVDVPDPQTSEDGGVVFGGPATDGGERAGPGVDDEDFRAADEACREHLDGVVGDTPPELDPETERALQEHALEFAQCMRDARIDFPDPQFGDSGGGGFVVELPEGSVTSEFEAAQETCMEKVGEPPVPDGAGGGEVGTKEAR